MTEALSRSSIGWAHFTKKKGTCLIEGLEHTSTLYHIFAMAKSLTGPLSYSVSPG